MMKGTLIKSLRSGAKNPYLRDDQHYLYRRNGDYKKGETTILKIVKNIFGSRTFTIKLKKAPTPFPF